VAFQLDVPAPSVTLKAYTTAYRLILRKSYPGPFHIGLTTLPLDLTDRKGSRLSDGTYYLVVELPSGDRAIGTLVLLK